MLRFFVAFVAFSIAVLFVNCGGKRTQMQGEQEKYSKTHVQPKSFVFTEKGLENIEIGKPFLDSTAVVENLYDRVEVKREFDEIGLYYRLYYNFYLGDSLVIYTEADDATKKIQFISVRSDNVELENGIRQGMSIHDLIEKYNLTIEYSKGEENAMISTSWNGFSIYFTSDQLTEKGQRKIANLDDYGSTTLMTDDLNENITISVLVRQI